MARGSTLAVIFYIALNAGVHAQLYEFFEALQPIVKSYPSFGDFSTFDNVFTTKKPKTFNRQASEQSQRTEEKKDRRKTPAAISTLESYLRDDARKKEKTTEQNISYVTTSKPSYIIKHSSQRTDGRNTKTTNNRGSSRTMAREIPSGSKETPRGSPSRNIYNGPLLVIDDFSSDRRKHSEDKFLSRTTERFEINTTKQSHNNRASNQNRQPNNSNNHKSQSRNHSNQSYNNQASNNANSQLSSNSNNQSSSNHSSRYTQPDNNRGYKNNYALTTQNPFYNRPGVRPAAVDDQRPPITNRPPSRRTTTLKPLHLLPKDTRTLPELTTVPGEDTMSDAERLRYIDMSERMCSKYKRLYTKQLQAIPLVPSPEPVAINVTSCAPSNIPLIVGGKVVTIREFPHMALIGWPKLNLGGYAWRCGGSLISDRFVLTAAHCAYEERDNSIVMGTPRAVQLGSSFLDDPNAVVMKIILVIRHPNYKAPKAYYDIALVKMATAVTFSEVIRPACLGVPPQPEESFIATGWGRTEFGGDQSKELRSVSLQVWEMEECYSVLGKSRKLPNGPSSDSQICGGAKEGGKDTCQGDSGGPAQIQDGCSWRVVAVTSVGRSCGAPNTPALYAIAQRAFIASVVFGEQTISAEIDHIDLNEQRYTPQRPTETFNYETNNWKTERNNVRNENSRYHTGNQNYNYNQQNSNDYTNNYEAYNQPYYNDAPTWF